MLDFHSGGRRSTSCPSARRTSCPTRPRKRKLSTSSGHSGHPIHEDAGDRRGRNVHTAAEEMARSLSRRSSAVAVRRLPGLLQFAKRGVANVLRHAGILKGEIEAGTQPNGWTCPATIASLSRRMRSRRVPHRPWRSGRPRRSDRVHLSDRTHRCRNRSRFEPRWMAFWWPDITRADQVGRLLRSPGCRV